MFQAEKREDSFDLRLGEQVFSM